MADMQATLVEPKSCRKNARGASRASRRETLITRPNSRGKQLEEMTVRISKVDARASLGPYETALDGNAPIEKSLSPFGQTPGGDTEA